MNSDQTFAIVFVLVLSTIFAAARILKGPIGEALARRLSGRTVAPDRDGELDELRARLGELEERVDFTERVLLQQPERGHVPGGGEHA